MTSKVSQMSIMSNVGGEPIMIGHINPFPSTGWITALSRNLVEIPGLMRPKWLGQLVLMSEPYANG